MSFFDVVPVLISVVSNAVPGVQVASRVQDPRPAEFIQVRRVGGSALVPVRDNARIDVLSWSGTDSTAMARMLTVRAAIWALPGTTVSGIQFYQVAEFMGPRLDDDTISGATGQSARAWMTFEVQIRADSAIQFI